MPPSGYGSGLNVALQVGYNTGTLTTAFSYDAPIVTGIEPARVPTSGMLAKRALSDRKRAL